jgi:undecaprenyl-diphosphatase
VTPSDRRTHRRRRIALGVLAAVLVTLLVLVTVAVQTGWGWVHTVDTRTADGLNRYVNAHRWQIGVWKAVTNAGQPTVVRIAALIAGIALWLRGRRRAAVFTLVAVEGTSLLSTLGKQATDRARPHVPDPVSALPQGLSAGSYPSGHALTAVVGAGVVAVLLWPVLGRLGRTAVIAGGVLVAGLVSFSRLILGVHFVTDVVAAWLLGALWLGAVALVFHPLPAPTLPAPDQRIGFGT